MGSFRLPGLAPARGRRPPQPGCFGLGAIAATKILFQLVRFQVYAKADNSSITIVCRGAVSDCGNLIKTTRLAVPSPARWFAVRLSMLLICRMAFITKKNQPGSFPPSIAITARKRRWPRHARQQPECSHVCVPTVPNGTTAGPWSPSPHSRRSGPAPTARDAHRASERCAARTSATVWRQLASAPQQRRELHRTPRLASACG